VATYPETSERVLAFPFDSERLALDFVGTVGDRANRRIERLRSPDDLGRWIVEAGLGEEVTAVGAADLERAHELREAIDRSVRAAMAGKAARRPDLVIINEVAAREALVPQLVGPDLRMTWMGKARPGRALSTVARDAIELLSGPDIRRVRECAAPDCSLLFIDESHAQRRRWCSMARCGNRAKLATYRRRRSGTRVSR
jgi:predicted RNA-binding Zn ribbon-like protein